MQILGHRGAKGEAPENTIAGFAYAKQLGLDAIELDVRLSADHQVVIIHDATVDRTTNGTGPVGEMTFAEIRALDARASFPAWPEACPVPTLAEVLDVMGELALIQIEFKLDTPERLERLVEHVIREIEPRDMSDRITYSSFDPVALEILQRRAPAYRRAYIGAWDSEDFFTTAHRLGCVQADINFRSGSAEIARRAQEEGLRVVGWPCDPDSAETALAWGVDAVTTDYPTALRERLAALAAR